MAKQFLIIHGLGGNRADHWQNILVNKLKNEKVAYPKFPNANKPKLKEWLKTLIEIVEKFDKSDDIIVLAHSLGCSLWLQFISKYPEFVTKKVYLVAPAIDDCGIVEINDFFPLPSLDINYINYFIIGSDNDPYIPFKKLQLFVKKNNILFKLMSGALHINSDSGFGDWEWMLKQCEK